MLPALSHPHMAQIHGLERSLDPTDARAGDGTRRRGGPLAADRARPTALDEALPIVRQIAEALEAAPESFSLTSRVESRRWRLRPYDAGRRLPDSPTTGTTRVRRVGDGGAGRVPGFREPEVQRLHRAVRAHLDVRRLQVPMDDPLLVRGFERLRSAPSTSSITRADTPPLSSSP
jgi:hypothetical protein